MRMSDPTNDERRPGERAPLSVNGDGDTTMLRQVADQLSYLQRQVLIEAFVSALPDYWERRARAFEAARPVPGEWAGNRTPEQSRAKWHELTEVAQACRARAQMCPRGLVEHLVDDVLREAS